MNESNDVKTISGKVSLPIYRRFLRVLDKVGSSVYAAVQNFVDVVIRFGDDRHNLTPEMEHLMSAFEHAEGWDKQFNLADPTTTPEISEATYYLRDKEKRGVRVVHVELPFFGHWTQTFNVKQIFERFMSLTFPALYKRMRFIAAFRDCNSVLELLIAWTTEAEAEEDKAELRKPFEDAERSEWGRKAHDVRYKIHHRAGIEKMEMDDLFGGDNHDSFIESENEQ